MSSPSSTSTRRTIRETIDLQMQWWRRENDRPLVGTFAPVHYPFGGMDFGVQPSEILHRKLGNVRAGSVVPEDSVPVAYPDLGTAFIPALAGAGIEYDGRTSWSHPCAESIRDLKVKPFDPSHPLWAKFMALFRPLIDNWSWDTYLPAATVMLGPLDILSGMLGPQTLAMELYENPELVCSAAMDAATLSRDAFDVQMRMIRKAGLTEGMADWMRFWLPGSGLCYSEDFCALCGEEHFRRFFMAPDARFICGLDSPFLHLHSAGLKCLPAILELPNLKAIEISNDPNGPDLDGIIKAARKVQAARIPLQLSNWEHPLTRDEIAHILDSVDARGLKITLQASSLAEAEALYDFAKSR